jgi:hypothetical protein
MFAGFWAGYRRALQLPIVPPEWGDKVQRAYRMAREQSERR